MNLDKKLNDKKGEKQMPKGQRKSYTKEFKLSVVYAMLGGTQRPKEIFAEYKIDRQTAYRWVSEFKAKGESAFEDKSVLPGDEVEQLRKENERLRRENEILKKARAYFAERNAKK